MLLGYADRILYVEDGQFKKQAINRQQMKLDYVRPHTQHTSHHPLPATALHSASSCVLYSRFASAMFFPVYVCRCRTCTTSTRNSTLALHKPLTDGLLCT